VNMTYSVAIPAYNAARTIQETVSSVLNQTVPPCEIVVVDDGSSDATAEIVNQFGGCVRIIQQANTGCGAATNAAIAATNAMLVAAVDADDVWLPHKMERQLARLAQLGADAVVFSKMRQFRHDDPDRGSGDEPDAWSRSTMLLHRATFNRVGPIIDPPGNCGEMVDWIARARHLGLQTDMMPEVLALRRIIPGSMTFNLGDDQRRAYLSVARAALLRRRKASQQ
jgi:glycosyltransferase involved in cell wall biosynthesis